jgi:alginate O-acetyltransferase complex protein AlgI
MIHYLIDNHRGKIPRHRLVDFLNYIFFFPILVSGPIQRFQPFLDDSRHTGNLQASDVYAGTRRIVWGFFKKGVLAAWAAVAAAGLQQQGLSTAVYWAASIGYTLQIYLDFSGYSDIAVGAGRLFGYRIMENFDSPYLAPDLSVFWKKWHMSLTGWFRDYVFIPLGGSRGTLAMTLRNTFIMMAVTGLWHGAAWHFMFWGIYHAVGLTVLRLYRRFALPILEPRLHLKGSPWAAWAGTAATFLFVNVGWVFFACDGRQAVYVVTRMFGIH